MTTVLLKPEVYAQSLVRLLGSSPAARRAAAVTTIGITERDNLEVRIMSLLRKRTTPKHKMLLIVVSSLLLVSPCVAAAKLALTFDLQLKNSLYPSLDEAALEAARKMRFAPALKKGQPVPQTVSIEFYFSPDSPPAGSQVWRKEIRGVTETRRPKEQTSVAQDERDRRQAELARGAVISMDQAIQIATSKYPGKVLACSLGRDKDGPVFYHLVLINTDGDKPTVTYVWLSAIDGTILKTQDEATKVGLRDGLIEGDVLNRKAVSLPEPTYPEIARVAHASGTVIVEITVDEEGSVIAARALMGHPLLQGANQQLPA